MLIDCVKKGLQNDKIVLENPHKGWYHHFVDQGFLSEKYRDEFSEDNTRLEAFGINHLYIRFDWSDIEKEDGVFDWSPVDKIMKQYASYKFGFRVCTFETRKETAFPKYLLEKGMKYKKCGDYIEPDYADDVFFKYLDRFMGEFGKKFNAHPQVEYIDMGTFGTWGEGHTWFGSESRFDIPVIIKHIDLHIKHFPDTPITINDDMIRHVGFGADMDWEKRDESRIQTVLDYCKDRKIGIRDDSICVDVHCEDFGFSTVCSPYLFDTLYPVAPVNLEMGHYRHCRDFSGFEAGYRMYDAMRECHATYAGFHGHLNEWIKEHKQLHDHGANKLGYWYFIDEINLPDLISGAEAVCELKITNKGFCHSYHRFDMKIILENEKNTYVLNDESPDNRKWQAESTNNETVILKLKNVPAGEYTLKIGMFEGDTPIKLGFEPKLCSNDGSYVITKATVKNLTI